MKCGFTTVEVLTITIWDIGGYCITDTVNVGWLMIIVVSCYLSMHHIFGDKNLPISCLVVWNHGIFMIFHILGMSSSQLTKSIIFQRGRSTTNQNNISVPEIRKSYDRTNLRQWSGRIWSWPSVDDMKLTTMWGPRVISGFSMVFQEC